MAELDIPPPSSSAPSAALAHLGLDAPLCELARPKVDEWAVRRIWEGIQVGKAPPPGRERPHVAALAAFAAVASMLALVLTGTQLIASLREPPPGSASASPTAALSPTAAPAAGATTSAVPSSSEGSRGIGPLLTRDARHFELLEAPPAPRRSVSARAGSASEGETTVAEATARVDFADGSSIEASPGARVEALPSRDDEFAVVVRRGLAQFRVTPGGSRRWRIDASHAQVEVLGTVLWVESDDVGSSVRVDVGRVLVRSPELPGGARVIEAGQSLRLGAPPPSPEAATAADDGSEAASPAARAQAPTGAARASHARPARARRVERAPAAPPSTREHDETSSAPVRARAGVASAAATLWEGADQARRNGEPAHAARLLQELVEEYPGDSQVALAAFTLGVLHLDHLGRPFDASEWFQRALELGLGAALREDAYLRWAEASSRARDRSRLAAVSAEYARLYPRGRHGTAIEELVRAAGRAPGPSRTPPAPDAAAKRPTPSGAAPARDR